MQKSDNHFTIGDRNIFHLAGFTWIRSDRELNIFQLAGSTRIKTRLAESDSTARTNYTGAIPELILCLCYIKTLLCVCACNLFVCGPRNYLDT
jgi:hypothetical protein